MILLRAAVAVGLLKAYHSGKDAQCFFFLFSKKKKKKRKGSGAADNDSASLLVVKNAAERRRKLLYSYGRFQRNKTRLLTELEIIKISTLVNELIDLDHFDEDSEQRIFEDCVRKIVATLEDVLPFDFFSLVHSEHYLGGIEEKQAIEIEERVIPYVKSLLSFPFLDASDESRVIHFVCKIVIEAMRQDCDLNKLYNRKHVGQLIVDVLMKGAISKIYDKDERDKLVDDAVTNWTSVLPFLPSSTLEFFANKVIDWCAIHLEEALITSYDSFVADHALKRVVEGATDSDTTQAEYRDLLIEHLQHELMQDFDGGFVKEVELINNYRVKFCKSLSEFIVDNAVDIDKITNVFDFQSGSEE